MSRRARPRLRVAAAIAGFALLGVIVVLQFLPPRNQAFWLLALAVGAYLAYAAYEAWAAPPVADHEIVYVEEDASLAREGASRTATLVLSRHPAPAHLDAPTLLCLLGGVALFSVNRFTAVGGAALIGLAILIRPRRRRGVYVGACPHCDADVSSLPASREGFCASCGSRFLLDGEDGAQARFVATGKRASAGGRIRL